MSLVETADRTQKKHDQVEGAPERMREMHFQTEYRFDFDFEWMRTLLVSVPKVWCSVEAVQYLTKNTPIDAALHFDSVCSA